MFRLIRKGVGKIIYICPRNILRILRDRRDARVVDWGGLENRCPGNWTEGSNPPLSADHITPFRLEAEGFCILWQSKPGLPERAMT